MTSWYAIPVNAEPWTAPSVGIGRKGGKVYPVVYKAAALDAYQAAVQSEMRDLYPTAQKVEGDFQLAFYIWRQLSVDGKITRNVIDATNAQKALEDALQGVLYENDRRAVHVETWMMAQGADVEPLIVIQIGRVVSRPAHIEKAAKVLIAEWPKPEPVFTRPDFDMESVF